VGELERDLACAARGEGFIQRHSDEARAATVGSESCGFGAQVRWVGGRMGARGG
jgi:hypothetical protein